MVVIACPLADDAVARIRHSAALPGRHLRLCVLPLLTAHESPSTAMSPVGSTFSCNSVPQLQHMQIDATTSAQTPPGWAYRNTTRRSGDAECHEACLKMRNDADLVLES